MAGQFMSLAAAQGYEVNKGVYSAWMNFQKRCIRNYKEPSGTEPGAGSASINQAYRLYTMALASSAETGAMNRLKESASIPAIPRWLLASAYALDGKKTVAKEIISGLKTETAAYSPEDRTFGSPLRDKAIMLESLVLADDIYGALELAADMADRLKNGLLSTQYAAFTASAMSRMADRLNTEALHAEISYTGISGQSAETINSTAAILSRALDISRPSVTIKNLSDGPVYATVTTKEKPAADAAISASASGIGLGVSWTDLDGNPVNPADLSQGSDFKVTVTVMNNSGTVDLSSLALCIPAPSGWEIFNERLYGNASAAEAGYEYMDIRDDCVRYYFDLARGTRKSFSVRFRAAYKGEFILPSISCEAMYSPENNAHTASGKAIVR